MKAPGLTVASLAREAGIPRETLRRRLVNPDSFTVAELNRLAAALGTDVLDLTKAS